MLNAFYLRTRLQSVRVRNRLSTIGTARTGRGGFCRPNHQPFSLWKMGLGVGALREGWEEVWRRSAGVVTRWSLVLLTPDRHQGGVKKPSPVSMISSPAGVPAPARWRRARGSSPSVPRALSFQRNLEQARARNNARSPFQVARIPTDNHIRQTLDPVASEPLMELFDDLHRACEEHGGAAGQAGRSKHPAPRAGRSRTKTTTGSKRKAALSNTILATARSTCARCWRR